MINVNNENSAPKLIIEEKKMSIENYPNGF